MSPKPRKGLNARLPDFLTTQLVRGVTYYRYWHRGEKRYVPFGRDRSTAIDAAKQCNAILANPGALAARALQDYGPSVASGLERFRVEYLAGRKLAAKTRSEWERMLRRVERDLAGPIAKLSVRSVAEFLDTLPSVASNRYRSLLQHVFKFWRAKGLIDHNPADATMIKPEEKARKRLSLDTYEAIYARATVPIRAAMRLSLRSCQARLEVSRMQFPDVVIEPRSDGRVGPVLHVHRQKTDAQLAIDVGPLLEAAIRECRDDVVSPFMVHQAIGANRTRRAKALSPESISRGFARARDATGLFKDVPPAERPTFHEIRSLGAKLLEDAGGNAQELMAHADRETTEGYLEGHAPTIVRASSL